MKKLLLTFSISLFTSCFAFGQAYNIKTIAGDSIGGFAGDNGAATAAELNGPFGMAVDSSGNIFFADESNQRIRKIDVGGFITTIAGNGTAGYIGDSGAATDAELYSPSGIAIDHLGNIYIADQANNCIRKINTVGTITTIAGNSNYGFSGDNGPATDAEFESPIGIAVDGIGNVYIADALNNRVRMVNSAGIITTIAGKGFPGFSGDNGQATAAALNFPYSIATDDSGNVYIVDAGNNRIRKVNTGGIITTIAGNGIGGFAGDGGQATAAELYSPANIDIDGSGNFYIVDQGNNRIRKVNSSGIISTIAGNGIIGFSGDGGNADSAELNQPSDLVLSRFGNIYFADRNNNRVRELTLPTGINEISNANGNVKVYPNPSNGVFTIQSSVISRQSTVEIYNMLGEKVYQSELEATTTQINLSNQPVGIYLYRVISAKGEAIATGKLVVEE